METTHTRGIHILLLSVTVLSYIYVGRGLATVRAVVQEILTNLYKEHSEIRRTGTGPHWTVVDPTLDTVQGDCQVNTIDDFGFLIASQCDSC